jgi:uncharacterized OB-fold protein
VTVAALPDKPGPHPSAVSMPFWEAAAEHQLLLQRCADCGSWQHYPRALCANCWSTALAWSEAAGTGTVWTVTVAHRPGHPAWSADVPYAIAIVELDEGPRLLANVVGCPPDAAAVGMRVRVAFERRAGYTAVQFTPTTEETHEHARRGH